MSEQPIDALPAEPENRDGSGRFRPGQSGNPGGRPRGLAARIREIAPPDELADFWKAVFTGDPEGLLGGVKIGLKERMEAATWLADRGYGRPAITVAGAGDGPVEFRVISAFGAALEDAERPALEGES